MAPRKRPRRCSRAFTLPEILVVLAILGILGLCIFRATESAASRADVLRCMGNLRNIHVALEIDVQERGFWPQCPYELGEDGFDKWWIDELKKYHIQPASWNCPTIMREQRVNDQKEDEQKIHYVPTPFDDNPFSPRRWPTQPWLVEIADSHGEGNLMAFPDGAIMGMNRYLANHR